MLNFFFAQKRLGGRKVKVIAKTVYCPKGYRGMDRFDGIIEYVQEISFLVFKVR